MVKLVNLMLGGPIAQIPELKQGATPWIGADHGIIHLLNQGIKPEIGLGDLDSLTPAEKRQLLTQVHDCRFTLPAKDFTDSQWALKTAFTDLKADQVHIYGATGGRLDHELVNLFTPTMPTFRPYLGRIKLIDRQNQMTFYGPGQYSLPYQSAYRYLAFVSLTNVRNLTLRQVKYPLTAYQADFPTSWASNEFLPQQAAHFSFSEGIVAVILSKDREF